jgi:hypothetical protein
MVRSIWLRTVAALLASTGLVWGQQAGAPAGTAAGKSADVITVQEMSRPAQKCVVIKTWQTADGARAYEVQALDTKEMMTIVESAPLPPPPGSNVRAAATRIFHWGPKHTPPAGAPVPPVEVVKTAPAPAPATAPAAARSPYASAAQPIPAAAPRLQPTPAAAPATPRTGSPALQRTSAQTTIPGQTGAPQVAAKPAASPCECDPCCSTPCDTCGQVTVCGECTPKRQRFPMINSLFSRSKESVGSTTVIGPMPTTTMVVQTPAPTTQTPVVVEQAQPGDWRQSWGKLDSHRSHLLSKSSSTCSDNAPMPPASQYAQADVPPPPPATVPAAPADTAKPAQPARKDEPKADTSRSPGTAKKMDARDSDPLKDPDAYTSHARTDKTKPAARQEKRADSPETASALKASTSDTTVLPPPPSPATAAQSTGIPLGARSVFDAGSPQYVPVPIVTVPDYRRPPQPPPPNLPQAPEPNRLEIANAFTHPPQNTDPGPLPAGMGNAFTPEVPRGMTPDPNGAFPAAPAGQMAQGMAPLPYGNPMAPGMMPRMPAAAGYPAGYLPAAGAPIGQAVRQAGYTMPAQGGQQAPYDGTLPWPGTMTTSEAMATLRGSLYPSQREWAAMKLATLDWRTSPDVVQALVTAAREDPAPTVRACCVHGLGTMKVNTVPVVTALQALKTDGDPRVLHEVEGALAVLAPAPAAATPAPSPSGLVPVKSN